MEETINENAPTGVAAKADKKVFILGAGSSISHSKGAFPGINNLLLKAKGFNGNQVNEYNLIKRFIQQEFGIDFEKEEINIEDVYTYIQITQEQMPDVNNILTKQSLVFLIQAVLNNLGANLQIEKGDYVLLKAHLNKPDSIITFNWDILLDDILGRNTILSSPTPYPSGPKPDVSQYEQFLTLFSAHYFSTFNSMSSEAPFSSHSRPYRENGLYLKLHGSIDWYQCVNTDCLYYGRVFPMLDPMVGYFCSECCEPTEVVIIPPALNKIYRQFPLIRRIWNFALSEISTASELIIWGYSFPPSDYCVHWLLRKGVVSGNLKRLVIVNPDVTKQDYIARVKNIFSVYKSNMEYLKYFSEY